MRVRDLPFLVRRPKVCAGLYLSASTVALAVAAPGTEQIACASEPVGDPRQAGAVLGDLVRRLGAQRSHSVLVAAPDSHQLMLVERPSVPAMEQRDAVRWRIQEFLDYPAADAVIDVFPFPEAASRGREPMVFVVATPRVRIETVLRIAREAGMSPMCVDIAELTFRNLVHRVYPSAENAFALLRVTPGSGIVNITRGDELFLSRRISSVPRELDDAAWELFKDPLLLQVQRSIDYYESALSQPPADCLLVTATHGWQPRVVAHLESMLSLPVRSLGRVLADALTVDLHDPQPQRLAADALTDAQDAAIAAALPALGAALRAMQMDTAT